MNLMQFQSKCQQAFWQNQQADSLNFIWKSKGTETGQTVFKRSEAGGFRLLQDLIEQHSNQDLKALARG